MKINSLSLFQMEYTMICDAYDRQYAPFVTVHLHCCVVSCEESEIWNVCYYIDAIFFLFFCFFFYFFFIWYWAICSNHKMIYNWYSWMHGPFYQMHRYVSNAFSIHQNVWRVLRINGKKCMAEVIMAKMKLLREWKPNAYEIKRKQEEKKTMCILWIHTMFAREKEKNKKNGQNYFVFLRNYLAFAMNVKREMESKINNTHKLNMKIKIPYHWRSVYMAENPFFRKEMKM